jgi:hypothetical protein
VTCLQQTYVLLQPFYFHFFSVFLFSAESLFSISLFRQTSRVHAYVRSTCCHCNNASCTTVRAHVSIYRHIYQLRNWNDGFIYSFEHTLFQLWVSLRISSVPNQWLIFSSRFFSNTGAVAGTFTVAGLLGVAGIIGAGMMIARRRISRSYEDDMEYLEKKPEPSLEPSQSQNFVVGDAEESSDIDHFGNSMEVTVPPAAHFYPQQDLYHGQAANSSDGYENHGYYPQEVYAPHEYGIAYPPMEPSAAEDPYGGIDETYGGMPNPFDDAASGLPAALRPSVQRSRTLIPPPAVFHSPDLHHSIDSFYGSSTGASNGHAM